MNDGIPDLNGTPVAEQTQASTLQPFNNVGAGMQSAFEGNGMNLFVGHSQDGNNGDVSANGEGQGSIQTIARIGSLLDRVTDLAQQARQSFMEGQHAQSSLCLGDLQKSLTEIGELGAASLALVKGREPNASSQSTALDMERTPSHGRHRRTMTESSLKKRPYDVFDSITLKSTRPSISAISTTNIDAPFEPPPSAPPALVEGGMATLTSSSSGPIVPASQAPEHPPSAPPFFSSGPTSAPATAQSNAAAISVAMMEQNSLNAFIQAQNVSAPPFTPISAPLGSGVMVNGGMGGSNGPSLGPSTTSSPSIGHGAMGFTHSQENSTGANSQQMSAGPTSPIEGGNGEANPFSVLGNGHSHQQSLGGRTASSGGDDDLAETGLMPSERGMSGAMVPPDLKANLDILFFEFLEKVCSDVDYADSKGEHLHQILTAKKMSRSSISSPTFKAFKFRIQAFTNAFHEDVVRALGGEEKCNLKQTRAYLWTSNYIARFNESGVKEKSKGNHVWRVEARKNGEGRFEFREFKRKIIAPAQVAYHGLEWTWPLRIWDPQAPSTSIKAVFAAHSLPPWIRWKEGDHPILFGVPDATCPSTQITVTAHYVARGHQQLVKLSATVDLHIMPLLESPMPPLSTQQDTNEDSIMDDSAEMKQAEMVIAPGQVANVMDQIGFPYTPPAAFGPRQHYFGGASETAQLDEDLRNATQSARQPLPSAPLPQVRGSAMQPFEQIQKNQIRELMARQEQAAATMPLKMPPVRRRAASQHSQQQPQMQSQEQQQQQQQQQQQDQQDQIRQQLNQMHQQEMKHAQEIQNQQQQQVDPHQFDVQQGQAQAQAQFQAQAEAQLHAQAQAEAQAQMQAQMQAQIQQVVQASQPQMMNMMQQPTVDQTGMMMNRNVVNTPSTIPGHPGLTLTPMSSMPQMANQLPQMALSSNDPMISPAIPLGFDPIAQEGARIHSMQQQAAAQQQQQQQHDQAQEQQFHQDLQ